MYNICSYLPHRSLYRWTCSSSYWMAIIPFPRRTLRMRTTSSKIENRARSRLSIFLWKVQCCHGPRRSPQDFHLLPLKLFRSCLSWSATSLNDVAIPNPNSRSFGCRGLPSPSERTFKSKELQHQTVEGIGMVAGRQAHLGRMRERTPGIPAPHVPARPPRHAEVIPPFKGQNQMGCMARVLRLQSLL